MGSHLWSLRQLTADAGREACLRLLDAMVSSLVAPSLWTEHYRGLTLAHRCLADSDPGPSARWRRSAEVGGKLRLVLTVTSKGKVFPSRGLITGELQTDSVAAVMLLCIGALQLEYHMYVQVLALLTRRQPNPNRYTINVRPQFTTP